MSASFWCWAPALALNPHSHDFFDRVDRLQDAQVQPPATVIVEFVSGLLKRFPDLSDTHTEGPWADGPMIQDANGQFIDIDIVWSEYPKVVPFVVSTARHFRLDCFDPQAYQFYSGKNATVETLPHSVAPVTSADAAIKKARHICRLDNPTGSSGQWQAVLVKDAKFGDEWNVWFGQAGVRPTCGLYGASVRADGSITFCQIGLCKELPRKSN